MSTTRRKSRPGFPSLSPTTYLPRTGHPIARDASDASDAPEPERRPASAAETARLSARSAARRAIARFSGEAPD